LHSLDVRKWSRSKSSDQISHRHLYEKSTNAQNDFTEYVHEFSFFLPDIDERGGCQVVGFTGRKLHRDQLTTASLKEAEKILQYTSMSVVYMDSWATYASMCSSGSVDPSYRSNIGFFQPLGNIVAIISSVKGYFPYELAIVVHDVSSRPPFRPSS